MEALPSTTWVSKLVLGVDIQRADGEGGRQVALWVEGVVRGFIMDQEVVTSPSAHMPLARAQ